MNSELITTKSITRYTFIGVVHIAFWLFAFHFFKYSLGYGSTNYTYTASFALRLLPVTMLISYFSSYFLIPNYLLKGEFRLFILYLVYTLIFAFFIINTSVFYISIFIDYLSPSKSILTSKSLPLIHLAAFFIVTIFSAGNLIFYNFRTSKDKENLRLKFLETELLLKEQELKYLKSQIHPHFLFNTLNTVYGLALQKADETPEMILRISELLDYILYQTQKPKVPLSQEINHLQDYIALEKMRFQDDLNVQFNIESSHTHEIEIAPMLLLFFLENSIKHGANKNGQLTIAIHISSDDHSLYFHIENSHVKGNKKEAGIGLQNIRKRLNLIYPNAHQLNIEETDDLFVVDLSIELA